MPCFFQTIWFLIHAVNIPSFNYRRRIMWESLIIFYRKYLWQYLTMFTKWRHPSEEIHKHSRMHQKPSPPWASKPNPIVVVLLSARHFRPIFFISLFLPTQIILCTSVVFYLYYRAITYPCKCMPKYLRVAQFSYQLEKENIMGEKRIFDPLQVNLILYYMALGKMKLHFLNIGLQYVFFSSFIGIFWCS